MKHLDAARHIVAASCPSPPPGMGNYADQITSWVKWGVLAMILVAALVSVGSILVGRIFSHPHASRYGAMGVGVVVIVAVLYVTMPGLLSGITGCG